MKHVAWRTQQTHLFKNKRVLSIVVAQKNTDPIHVQAAAAGMVIGGWATVSLMLDGWTVDV